MTIQQPTFNEEKSLLAQGYKIIAGVDEAGAGCWAGPVFAGACVLPFECSIALLRDSKKLSASQREKAFAEITEQAVAWAIGIASAQEIDEINIRQAGALAMKRAIFNLSIKPDYILVDAFGIPDLSIPQKGIIRGDSLVKSISAASIIAKVSRDNYLGILAEKFPEYGFEKHKGYGTKIHQATLMKFGPCVEHRKTYAPIKKILEKVNA